MSPEDLLRHKDFVRALARRLVFDEDRAEDVVQETWLAALRSPPRDPWDRANTETEQVKLEGKTTRLDFGAAAPMPEWQGAVRRRDGTIVAKRCLIQMSPVGLKSGYSHAETAGDGTFSIRRSPAATTSGSRGRARRSTTWASSSSGGRSSRRTW